MRVPAASSVSTTCSRPPAADMLRRLGRRSEAAEAYRRAYELAGTDAERRYLERRLQEVTA